MCAYRPFLNQPPHLSMAIKSLDEATWLEIGDEFDHQMAERHRLLDQHAADVVDALPGSEASQDELLAMLLQHLADHHADRYRVSPKGVEERQSGRRFTLTDETHAPLMLIGRLVQEDFCLLQQRFSAYQLVAAVLCFPAHWRLCDKIGRSLIDIHEPVPGFANQLGQPISRLFQRLDSRRPVQRLNWSLVDTSELYLPPSHRKADVDITEENAGARLWLRVERQTLRRLPVTSDIVFGIRTHLTRLDDALDDPSTAKALMTKIETMPAAMADYKNLKLIKKPLKAYLERRFDESSS